VNDDPDLRSRLERIASSAGDPPEHGLERVAARRHRRLRRRRGAVAAAAVLAVVAVGVPLIEQGLDDDRESVTASDTGRPSRTPPEVPDEVVVRCEPTGIVVPVASVRPQNDGLNIRVVNSLRDTTRLRVTTEGSDGWDSGDIEVEPGEHRVEQPVPPGEVTIGCEIGGEMQRRLIELVDPLGYYLEPALECEADVLPLEDLPVEPVEEKLVWATRSALIPSLIGESDDYAVEAPRGYPTQSVDADTVDPKVQVSRDGKVVAMARVRGAEDRAEPPWTIVHADVCGDVVDASVTGDTTSTSAPPDPPEGAPPEDTTGADADGSGGGSAPAA
jgi:hypothetical protein